MANICNMIDKIEKKYGKKIQGKEVRRMPEAQIKAIYFKIVATQTKKPEHTIAARCGTCGWWSDNKCYKSNFTRMATSLACRTGYDSILDEDHQMTLFEGGK